MRFDRESIGEVGKKLAILADDSTPKLQSAVSTSLQANCPKEALEACYAVAAVVLQKAILTNRTTPGDVTVALASAAVKEYDAQVEKKREQSDLFLDGISRGKVGPQADYRKNKALIDGAWNFAREKDADPVQSLGLIAVTYCEHVAKQVLGADALDAMQSELEGLVTRVHAAIQGA